VSRARAAALAATVLLAACSREPVVPPVSAPAVPAAAGLLSPGDELMGRGDYTAAEVKYRQAVALESGNVAARYGLGAALSHLDRREDAISQFQWVLRLGGEGSPFVEPARRWRASVGGLPTARARSRAITEVRPPLEQRQPGRVRGDLRWIGLLERDAPWVSLTLQPSPGGRLPRYTARGRVGGDYEFEKVIPGRYRLVGQAGHPPIILWSNFVVVQPGADVMLDLTASNATVPADTLPFRLGSTPLKR